MAKPTYDGKMKLDMPFSEALERFVGTDPKEMHANVKRAKKRKPPGGKKAPSGSKAQSGKVVRLRGNR